MLLFDLSGPRRIRGPHSHPDNGNIGIELKFEKDLPDAITCLLFLGYDNSFRIDYSRTVSTNLF
jgi:hypothetical protein